MDWHILDDSTLSGEEMQMVATALGKFLAQLDYRYKFPYGENDWPSMLQDLQDELWRRANPARRDKDMN